MARHRSDHGPFEARRKHLGALDTIRRKIRSEEYEVVVPHFVEEMINDGLGFGDIEMAIARGRIRRRFTHDPRGIRYEVVGQTADGRKVAVICRVKGTGTVLLVTTYLVE